MNPADLGYYEKRAGSGIWYRPGDDRNTFEPKVCGNSDCGRGFMGARKPGKGQFCSMTCRDGAHINPDGGYGTRHSRVKHARGPASEQTCVDCSNPAAEWSQRHGTTGQDPQDYDPRCHKCHHAYDADTAARGERINTAILTGPRVRGIKASVGASVRELAELHGVSRDAIRKVLNGKTWRHI